jgi:hypothetical protein
LHEVLDDEQAAVYYFDVVFADQKERQSYQVLELRLNVNLEVHNLIIDSADVIEVLILHRVLFMIVVVFAFFCVSEYCLVKYELLGVVFDYDWFFVFVEEHVKISYAEQSLGSLLIIDRVLIAQYLNVFVVLQLALLDDLLPRGLNLELLQLVDPQGKLLAL